MRVLAVTVGVLVAVVAAWVLIATFSASRGHVDKPSAVVPAETDIPIALQRRVDCMYEVLTTTPGIREPRQGRVTSSGWSHPFLEYSATINPYVDHSGATIRAYTMRFEAQRNGRNHDEYWYWFLHSFGGPPPPGLDGGPTELLMRNWKGHCHVDAEIEIN